MKSHTKSNNNRKSNDHAATTSRNDGTQDETDEDDLFSSVESLWEENAKLKASLNSLDSNFVEISKTLNQIREDIQNQDERILDSLKKIESCLNNEIKVFTVEIEKEIKTKVKEVKQEMKVTIDRETIAIKKEFNEELVKFRDNFNEGLSDIQSNGNNELLMKHDMVNMGILSENMKRCIVNLKNYHQMLNLTTIQLWIIKQTMMIK